MLPRWPRVLPSGSCYGQRAAARVEAIKTGLGIGAGTTGIFALPLAVRRQQHNESDATEKNVTELYTKAADQLGSDEARSGWPGCTRSSGWPTTTPASARASSTSSAPTCGCPTPRRGHPASRRGRRDAIEGASAPGAGAGSPARGPAHPRRASPAQGTPNDLDLTNAHLINFTLESCRVRTTSFSGVTFTGGARFDGATFDGATFDGRAPVQRRHRAGSRRPTPAPLPGALLAMTPHTLRFPESDRDRTRHAHIACVAAQHKAGKLLTRAEWERSQRPQSAHSGTSWRRFSLWMRRWPASGDPDSVPARKSRSRPR
ncbi:hypothetical protein SAMN04489730_6432 [Amycolatopsis australiensis]|uniref:Pentapeptide repeat-containing protein n=1 Tax=Amycolatopsis australiensis TaxID=546364 RepID=A0A1K1SRV6_9PSEU|nr:hypothetical protein SAMN04489730_6432 [Amycolatopsis australiensis]